MSKIIVIDVPTEAGTHFPGQTRAPQAFHNAGLDAKLREAGYEVYQRGDILHQVTHAATWKPSPKTNGVRNEEATLQVLRQVRKQLVEDRSVELEEFFPIILGGDCSITPAVLSAVHHLIAEKTTVGLLYMDGDVDLTTPADAMARIDSTGILDSMVMTHLTQRPGGLPTMREFASRDGGPIATPGNTVLFGFDPLQLAPDHWVYLLENNFKAFARPTIKDDASGAAKRALEWLEQRVNRIVLHFDVDVIDSGEFPLANYPHYAGLAVEEALAAVRVFLASPKVRGLVVTEVNPNNDPSNSMVERLVDGIVAGFRERLSS